MPQTIIISALSYDRVIGSGAGMPWSVPEEYAQFLSFVEGQSVIMGSRSFEIFGKDLTTTRNFVISRRRMLLPHARVFGEVDAAIHAAADFPETIFIAGGGSIYAQSLDKVDKMYLSYIKGDFEGDTWFPEFDPGDWRITRREDHASFEFVVYEKAVPA